MRDPLPPSTPGMNTNVINRLMTVKGNLRTASSVKERQTTILFRQPAPW